jgi:chemotaxis protein MotB
MVSYADFMTLMFALFVVLFASSHHDKMTFQRASTAFRKGFQELGSFSDTNASPAISRSALPNGGSALGPAQHGGKMISTAPEDAGINVGELQQKLGNALGKEIEQQEVEMRMTPEGFVISLHELGFFDSGEARLLPGAADKIKRIAAVLMQYGLDMRVEGHSDNVPIHNAAFNSNWDLSTARATAVAMMLLNDSNFDPRRMSIAGYAQYHPAATNDTLEGRKANRRVDIVILSASRASVAKTP